MAFALSAETAFRASEAMVVVNETTAKTQQGKRWYGIALDGLTNALAKVTGVVPAVYGEGDEPHDVPAIYLGESRAARAAGITGAGLRNGDWRVKTAPGKAFLFGKTGMASVYAVTEFVERYCGYLFLSPAGHDPYVRKPSLAIPVGDVTVRPPIYVRRILTGTMKPNKYPTLAGKWYEWEARRRGNYTDEIEPQYMYAPSGGWCHSIFNYLPPEKHFKDHPEWFSMGFDGKRRAVRDSSSQICYTNPEARQKVLEHLLEIIADDRAKNPTGYPGVYDLTQMDNTSFMCLCPECKKVIAKYNRKEGGHAEGGDAGLQLEFVNDLARKVRTVYPDVMLRVFAYVSTECPPKPGTIAVESNVVIFWCDLYSTCDHTLPLDTPGHYNTAHADILGEWLSLTKNVQVWDYMLGTDDYPEVAVDAIAADARFFAKRGLPYVFMETDYRRQPFFLLDCFVMSEHYLHPNADIDKTVRRFCRLYGKGARGMEKAIAFLRRQTKEHPADTPMSWHSRMMPWKNNRNMVEFARFCAQAHDCETNPVRRAFMAEPIAAAEKARLKLLRNSPGRDLMDAGKAYRRWKCEALAYSLVEPRDLQQALASVDEEVEALTLKFDDVPAELAAVPESELVYIDYLSAPVWRRCPDPVSSRGHAMVRAKKDKDFEKGYPVSCGLYDFYEKETIGNYQLTVEQLPPDGKYHWVRIGRMRLGRITSFWFPWSWSALATLSDYYIAADGAERDPNRYDMWVSMRVAGPRFVPGSTDENAIFLDRILLRRITE